MTATSERAAALSRKMKPLSTVLLKKNRKHSVADVLEFSNAPPVNPDFSRLTDNKTVYNKRWGSMTFWRWSAWRLYLVRCWRGFCIPSS